MFNRNLNKFRQFIPILSQNFIDLYKNAKFKESNQFNCSSNINNNKKLNIIPTLESKDRWNTLIANQPMFVFMISEDKLLNDLDSQSKMQLQLNNLKSLLLNKFKIDLPIVIVNGSYTGLIDNIFEWDKDNRERMAPVLRQTLFLCFDTHQFDSYAHMDKGPRMKTMAITPADPLTTAEVIFKELSMPVKYDRDLEEFFVKLINHGDKLILFAGDDNEVSTETFGFIHKQMKQFRGLYYGKISGQQVNDINNGKYDYIHVNDGEKIESKGKIEEGCFQEMDIKNNTFTDSESNKDEVLMKYNIQFNKIDLKKLNPDNINEQLIDLQKLKYIDNEKKLSKLLQLKKRYNMIYFSEKVNIEQLNVKLLENNYDINENKNVSIKKQTNDKNNHSKSSIQLKIKEIVHTIIPIKVSNSMFPYIDQMTDMNKQESDKQNIILEQISDQVWDKTEEKYKIDTKFLRKSFDSQEDLEKFIILNLRNIDFSFTPQTNLKNFRSKKVTLNTADFVRELMGVKVDKNKYMND